MTNNLSVSKIKSEHTDAVIHRELASRECAHRPDQRSGVSSLRTVGLGAAVPNNQQAIEQPKGKSRFVLQVAVVHKDTAQRNPKTLLGEAVLITETVLENSFVT